MSIAANKVPGVYARLPRSTFGGEGPTSNSAQVLTLVARDSSAREVAKIGSADAARARGDLPSDGRAGSVDATPGSSR